MKINDCFVLREIYGKYLLFPIRRNEIGNELILLNEVGADIWNYAQNEMSEQSIVQQIIQDYDLLEDSVEAESVRQFIAVMCDQKLLKREGE